MINPDGPRNDYAPVDYDKPTSFLGIQNNLGFEAETLQEKLQKNVKKKKADEAFLKAREESDKALFQMGAPAFSNPDTPYIFKTDFQQAEADVEAELDDPETLAITNADILANGKFRFNDIVLDIPPEQISIHIDEYEKSHLLMRQDVPVTAQSGKKRVRIIVNFPVDIAGGWTKLAKMVVQIRKTPIATIENEKIRKELFGHLDDFENIGVVVDNFSGYVEDEFPTLLRCTVQMSWFNHAPYVEQIKYVTQDKQGDVKWQITPSDKFVEFYKAGTANGNVFINDPGTLVEDRSLVVMYKEYHEFKNTVTRTKMNNGSNLNGSIEGGDDGTFKNAEVLRSKGWYLASEAKDKWDEVLDGVFYRWRKIEIPYTDLDTSGALILQNMSFSLSTNPSYISMESYAFPTIQFMGGSVSEVRAMVFAAAEYESYEHRLPIGTSRALSSLMSVFKQVSDDRIRFPKYAKENHLLICHPVAKLMKYRSYANSSTDLYVYLKEGPKGFEKDFFNIDDYLPVILSSSASSTVSGIPYASRVQLDFKETRLAQNRNVIKYRGTTGSTNNEFRKTQSKNPEQVQKDILKALYARTRITLGTKGMGVFEVGSHHGAKEKAKADLLANALTALRFHDRSVIDIDSAFKSAAYKDNEEMTSIPGRVWKGKGPRAAAEAKRGMSNRDKDLIEDGILPESFDRGNILRPDFVEQFIIGFYSEYGTALAKGEEWIEPYIDLFEDFARITPLGHRDVYSDIMIPERETTPAYYFASNENRTQLIRNNILRNMAKNYPAYQFDTQALLHASEDTLKGLTNSDVLTGHSSYNPAYNYSAIPSNKDKGVGRVHEHNSQARKEMTVEYAMARASAPTDSLGKVYPAFQVHLYSDRYLNAQVGSANDMNNEDLSREQQFDLLDMYDLSSIMDIRIIKDEYEAADVMIIRILQTQKKLMTNQDKDPTYNAETFKFFGEGGVADRITDGTSVLNTAKTNNLEVIGLKEGTKIRAYLGYTTDMDEMGLEFNGKISAINGKDVIEIYCMGDGHELIQDTKGYERDTYKLDSETTDLLGDVLSKADEVQSFGNTKYQVIRGAGVAAPDFMGGVSALDNIYAPSMWPGFNAGTFGMDTLTTGIGAFSTIAGVSGILIAAGVIASAPLAAIGLVSLGLTAGYNVIAEISNKTNPCQFIVYQQTIWDIMQELTLRHPGYICAVVPFDNRSTIYFGEPDGIYFYRGVKSSLERAILATGKIELGKNATVREVHEKKTEERFEKEIESNNSTSSFAMTNAKMQTQLKGLLSKPGQATIDDLALLNMQKTFRNYHFVTSEHDIVSNDIEASSVGVANSVQVYHPVNNDNGSPDGKEWFSDYKLTDKMKADDDLLSNHVNNKIFTFHNAFGKGFFDKGDLELPQRYAKAILCKELENTYKGKLTILGRQNIKPHDVVILRDTYNKISGPIGVQRVTHVISPTTGWVTNIYPKFMVFPDTASSAFQMKSVLKASRYWLGAEAELFYSNMEKFRPSEIANSDQFMDDLFRAADLAENGEQFDNSLSKSDTERGEMSAMENISYNSGDDVIAAATTVGINQAMGGTSKIIKGATENIDQAVQGFKKTGGDFKEAWKSKKYFRGPGGALLSGTKITAKVGGKLFTKAALGFAGGFLIENLLTGMAEGFISYMKYRQPISIFPLTKEGKPWTAGLNGMVENTAIEHLKLQADRGTDKMGFMVGVAKELFNHWTSDVPPDIGYGGTYDVVPGSIQDGDTLQIKNGTSTETVRIKGFDAGELKNEGNTKRGGPNEVAMGEFARRRAQELIAQSNGKVEIIRNKPDNYARTVGEVTVKINGRDIADILRDEDLVLNYPSGMPKKIYYDKFAGGAEQVWGEKLERYKRKNPNATNINPILNTLNPNRNSSVETNNFAPNTLAPATQFSSSGAN